MSYFFAVFVIIYVVYLTLELPYRPLNQVVGLFPHLITKIKLIVNEETYIVSGSVLSRFQSFKSNENLNYIFTNFLKTPS